jgi:short-subunit dehydrogenase
MEEPKSVACITGASSGIGAEFARQLAGKGYDLVLVARRKQRLDDLASSLTDKYPIHVESFPADLSVEDEIKRVACHIQGLDRLEVLVNNAGFGIPGSFAATPIDSSLTMLSVHVLAVVRLTHAALPGMTARGAGYIINVSSLSAFTSALGNVMYSATKSFINGFSDALATDLIGTGVKVQALCPGMTHTEFHSSPAYEKYRDPRRIPEFAWMTTEQVVKKSLNAIQHIRVIYVPGLGNQLIAFLGAIGWVRWFAKMYYKVTGKHPSEHLEE